MVTNKIIRSIWKEINKYNEMWGLGAILLKSSSLFSTIFLFWYMLFVGNLGCSL